MTRQFRKTALARLALIRRGLIPWLAGIDPDTGAPRRRVARLSEIPNEARPLIGHLVEQRLLATDVAKDTGEKTIEPAHEALLRQWSLLEGWLAEDAGLLAVMEGVKRASRDWAANNRDAAWLAHATDRLVAAQRLSERSDLAANLEPTDGEYLAACRNAEAAAKSRKRHVQAFIYVLLVGIIAGLVGWINQGYVKEQWRFLTVTRPFMQAQVRPYVLTAGAEHALKPLEPFKECAKDTHCPVMIVVPPGLFMMGSTTTEEDHDADESPQHEVMISEPFAVSRFDVTFDEWDTCIAYGDCDPRIADSFWGRGQQPVINLNWNDAQRYVAWLSRMTGKPYRLLTEAEYEYATRAGTQGRYPWGNEIGENNANCSDCGTEWGPTRPAPVGSFPPNRFGLFDMVGNVFKWVEDCYHSNFVGAPADGSAWIGSDCNHRVGRGGAFNYVPRILRSANRFEGDASERFNIVGFRIARTLSSSNLTARSKRELDQNISDLNQAILQDPDSADAFNNLGLAYSARGDLEKAIVAYKQAIILNPNFGNAYSNLGNAYDDTGDGDHAIASWSKVILLDPQNAAAFNNRGTDYLQKDDAKRAIADFDKAIALNPSYATAYNPKIAHLYNDRCWDRIGVGQLQEALSDCNLATGLRPRYAEALDSRGFVYLKLGETDLAIDDFNSALTLSKLPTSLYGRGLAKKAKGDDAAGAADIEAATAINAKIADVLAEIGIK